MTLHLIFLDSKIDQCGNTVAKYAHLASRYLLTKRRFCLSIIIRRTVASWCHVWCLGLKSSDVWSELSKHLCVEFRRSIVAIIISFSSLALYHRWKFRQKRSLQIPTIIRCHLASINTTSLYSLLPTCSNGSIWTTIPITSTNVLLGCRITSWNGIRCFGQGGNWSRKVFGSTRVFLVNVTSNRCPIFLNSRSPQFGPKTTSFKMYLHPC